MIKINLTPEQRAGMEEILLQDLIGSPPEKPGKLIAALDKAESRRLLQDCCQALYDYLYNGSKVNEQNVRALLLADRGQMESFMKQFASADPGYTDELLDKVFQYRNFANRKAVRDILQVMEVPVCPYCNRLYITALKTGEVRAQLDHFFPKKKYPYLALSLYNLIPSCGVCNQAKLDMDTGKEPLLYPYEEEFGEKVAFTLDLGDREDFVQKMQGASSQIGVRIKNPEPSSDLGKKVTRQDDRLHLTDLYNANREYIADILRSYYINTEARVAELLRCFPELFSTRDEVRSLLFMNCLKKSRWGERPLAKLTHDICRELEELSV